MELPKDTEGSKPRQRAKSGTHGEDVRGFILSNVEKHPKEIANFTAEHFGITRQAANKHLKKLVTDKALTPDGHTRSRSYRLTPLVDWRGSYQIVPDLAEDQAWAKDVSPALGKLPKNVLDIWRYCFTEMFNNAVDHSGGSRISIEVIRTAANTELALADDGVGIFKKIQAALGLLDERHAVMELSKGKLTTDPKRHTGQGIFFSSRMVDSFDIFSGGVLFMHELGKEGDWIAEQPKAAAGTTVFMRLSNHSHRTAKEVFDQFSSGEDYGFTKTVVPVRLALYGEDKLISRSQAKRLVSRVDLFKVVLFDFQGVETIGPAFADEIFRIFARDHPAIEVVPINANPEVQQMIVSARSRWASEVGGV